MGYTNAGVVLPDALIREIQRYVNGISLYIPQVKRKKAELNPYRCESGTETGRYTGRSLRGTVCRNFPGGSSSPRKAFIEL